MMQFMLTRRSFMTLIATMTSLTIVGAVILSPFALAQIAHFRSDWTQLSNIGQTYGAISAILSALALGGILASLLFQARDSRIAHEQLTRTFQFELIKLELDDPSLMMAMGAPWGLDIPTDSTSLKQFLYVQMWLSYLAGSYAVGEMPSSTVKQVAALELFRGKAGRTYWAAVGARQLANSKGRRNRFFRILDEEYKRAITDTDASIECPPEYGPSATSAGVLHVIQAESLQRAGMFAIMAVGGVLAGRFWRCNRLNAKNYPED